MFTPRRSAAVLLTLLVFTGWFAWLRPTALGGPATFIMISGDSMEPTYSHGDLVVLHRASSYQPGDIVAYPMKTYFDTGRLVIHRVVGTDDRGFITQGDNRETADPWRPASGEIRGKAWAHIPKLGNYMAWLRQPNHLGALAAGILLIGGIGGVETRRRRRHGMKRHFTGSPGQPGGGLPSVGFQPALAGLAVAAGALAVLFLVLGIFAFRSAPHAANRVSQPTYSETGSFSYEIQMEPSTIYPDGVLRSPESPPAPGAEAAAPQPAFASLAREARLTFQYQLEAGAPADLGGTIAADLVVRPRGGEWLRTTPLLAAEPFQGTTAARKLTLDLVALKALIAQVEEETGLRGGGYELTVVAKVEGKGTYAGSPLETSFESPFTLTYDGALITPPAELTSKAQASVTETVAVSRKLSLGVWSPTVTLARGLALTGFSTAFGAATVLGGYLAFLLRNDEQARIRARYGSQMVDVQATESAGREDAIGVASIRDLARLAERFGSVILHQPLPDGHRYFVRDGDDTYEYVITAAPNSAPVAADSAAGTPGS